MRVRKNIGTADRIMRFIIACVLLGYAVWAKSWIVFALSIFTFYEVIASFCIFYYILGKNSCPIDKNKS